MMVREDCILLTVITPENTLLEINASKVELPGAKGRFVVLKDHIPVITSLVEGYVVYTFDGKDGRLKVKNGFAEVCENKITVCVEV